MPAIDLPLWQLFIQGASTLIAMSVLGSLLAWLFKALGDEGPIHDGRGTPNPASQVAIWAFLLGAIVRIGWTKPLDVNAKALRGGVFGLIGAVLVALAVLVGLANLASWFAPKMVTLFQPPFGLQLSNILNTFAQTVVMLAVINLVPLPPFAMGHVLRTAAPSAYERLSRHFWLIGLAIGVLFYALGRSGVLQHWHGEIAQIFFRGSLL